MNVVADRVNRLCGFLGTSDDEADQNATLAEATGAILGRTVTIAEIAAVREGAADVAPELLRAIAIHFDVDARYITDPHLAEMRVLDQKLAILETARTLGIKLGGALSRRGRRYRLPGDAGRHDSGRARRRAREHPGLGAWPAMTTSRHWSRRSTFPPRGICDSSSTASPTSAANPLC